MNARVEHIEGVAHLADGRKVSFLLNREGGFVQWGAGNLGDTVGLMESLSDGLADYLWNEDEGFDS